MKTILGSLLILAVTLALIPVQLQVTGIWQGEVMSGNSEQLWSMELRQSGLSVTGTVWQDLYRQEITEGRIDGDTVALTVAFPGNRTITFTGEITAEEIRFTRNVQIAPGGQPGGNGIYGARAVTEFTVRRVPDGVPGAEPRGLVWPRQLIELDRTGTELRTLGEPGEYAWPALSPDGRRLAVIRPDRTQPRITSDADPGYAAEVRDLWVFDLSTGTQTHVVSGPVLRTPVWSPDGNQIAYSSYRDGHGGVYRSASDGTGAEELLYQFPLGVFGPILNDWSQDGRFLVFGGGVLSVLPLDREPSPVDLVREEYSARGGSLSPDSRFLAYMSDESGLIRVYVQEFDPSALRLTGEKWDLTGVSDQDEPSAQTDPRVYWEGDSGELYFQNYDLDVMAVEVSAVPEFRARATRPLFRAPSTGRGPWMASFLTVSQDGQRFVAAVPERREVSVAPEALARYAGTYELEPDLTELVISLEGDQLWSKTSGEQERVGPMVARSEASFYSNRFTDVFDTVTAEEIDFIIDDRGEVTHLTIYNLGAGRTARRK